MPVLSISITLREGFVTVSDVLKLRTALQSTAGFQVPIVWAGQLGQSVPFAGGECPYWDLPTVPDSSLRSFQEAWAKGDKYY